MTCLECQDLMLEVSRDRAAPLIRRAVLLHAESCRVCAACLARERAVTAGLRAVALNGAGSTPASDLESRLLAAFAFRQSGAQPATPVFHRSGAASARRWLPLAAVVALCVAGAAWWRTPPVPSTRETPRAAVNLTAPSIPAAGPIAVEAPVPVQTSRVNAPRPDRRATRPGARGPIQAVGFVPIPSAAGLPEFESGQIVRLDIPVAALPTFGVDVPSGAESSIQADLLVGQDGRPRAIRLVNANANAPDTHLPR